MRPAPSLPDSLLNPHLPCLTSTQDQVLPPGGALVPGGANHRCSPCTTQLSHPTSGAYLTHETTSPDNNRLESTIPVVNRGCSISTHHPTQRVSKAFLGDIPLRANDWTLTAPQSHVAHMIAMDPLEPTLVSNMNPLVLTIRTSKYDADNPSWETAMYGPFQDDFWGAMESELNTLKNHMHSWELVPRTPDMHVLPSTWAFKIKCFPNG